MKLSKSRVVKGYSVNIAEEKFTIPVTVTEPEPGRSHDIDGIDNSGYIDDIDFSDGLNLGESDENEEYREHERDGGYINENSAENAEVLAHLERIEELSGQAREIERTSRLIGEEIIGQAQRTAELIINHTLERAKTELENAISQGYSDGFENGKNEAMNIISPALGKIGVLTDAVMQTQDKMLEDFKDEMFDIIAEISKKILQREIDEKDEYLITLFGDAVKNIRAENFVTVTVSEAQAEFAVRNIDLFRSKVANIEDFRIIPDKNAERGTMIVETAKTVADASFSVQTGSIDAIIERMKETLSVMPPPDDSENEFNLDNLNYSDSPGGEDLANFPDGFNGLDGFDVDGEDE